VHATMHCSSIDHALKGTPFRCTIPFRIPCCRDPNPENRKPADPELPICSDVLPDHLKAPNDFFSTSVGEVWLSTHPGACTTSPDSSGSNSGSAGCERHRGVVAWGSGEPTQYKGVYAAAADVSASDTSIKVLSRCRPKTAHTKYYWI